MWWPERHLMKSTDSEQDRDAQNNGVSFDGHTFDGFDHKEVLSKQFLGLWGMEQWWSSQPGCKILIVKNFMSINTLYNHLLTELFSILTYKQTRIILFFCLICFRLYFHNITLSDHHRKHTGHKSFTTAVSFSRFI